MNIFILEDDFIQRQRLVRLITEVAKNNSINIHKLLDTSKPKELIDNIDSNRSSQMVYFLDIEIKGDEKKGLEVAKAIRALDRFATIIFITTHSEFSVLTYSYQVSALQFLTKDQEDSKLKEEITSCLDYVQKSAGLKIPNDVFRFENEYRLIEVPYAQISYFETFYQPHKIALITATQRIEFYANLSEIEKMDDRLYRCHKSLVVNIENIVDIDRTMNKLKLADGLTCDFSKRKFKDIQRKSLILKSEITK